MLVCLACVTVKGPGKTLQRSRHMIVIVAIHDGDVGDSTRLSFFKSARAVKMQPTCGRNCCHLSQPSEDPEGRSDWRRVQPDPQPHAPVGKSYCSPMHRKNHRVLEEVPQGFISCLLLSLLAVFTECREIRVGRKRKVFQR